MGKGDAMREEWRTDIEMERKLEQIRKMREERNRSNLSYESVRVENPPFQSFRFRFLIALILFGTFVAWDHGYLPQIPGRPEQVLELVQTKDWQNLSVPIDLVRCFFE